MDSLFNGIFDTTLTNVINVSDFLLCVAVSIVIGIIFAAVFSFKANSSKSFLITLALLPATVCVVIMMVNGNIGTGVAVAGAFSLVRFRSAPGSAKEIAAIFLAMASGLIAGMGYLAYSALFAVILCAAYLVFNAFSFRSKNRIIEKTLNITIPENLDYNGVFDDIFEEYLKSAELISVKTSGLGSLYKLKYDITLKDPAKEKEMIDALRCRNGNLEICCSIRETNSLEL
ncbi:MAG: DUF4956 domain-containing protein [Clostridia bacterium]|nr:DUF4956 domain-containing protein [Clostridia bacterium]MBO5299839.1 DUF4956 domain-containing protein [Clostridia bacterium]